MLHKSPRHILQQLTVHKLVNPTLPAIDKCWSEQLFRRTGQSTVSLNKLQARNLSTVGKRSQPAPLLTKTGSLFISRFLSTSPIQRSADKVSEASSNTTESVSRVDATSDVSTLPDIPGADIAEVLQTAGEPTLASMGLCSWWPTGWLQSLLETLHISCGLEWWQAIICVSVAMRIMILPLQIKANKLAPEGILYLKHMEYMQRAEKHVSRGELGKAQDVQSQYILFRKEYGNAPSKWVMMYGPMYQVPIMLTMYRGISSMADLPVPSMMTGGAAWFTDLTVADPMLILPITTALTVALLAYIGPESARLKATPSGKYVMFGGCTVLALFLSFRPNALCLYWTCSNIIGTLLMMFVKSKFISSRFDVLPDPKRIQPSPTTRGPTLTLKQRFRARWESFKHSRTVMGRAEIERKNIQQFREAGRSKKVTTFKENPLKKQSQLKGVAADK